MSSQVTRKRAREEPETVIEDDQEMVEAVAAVVGPPRARPSLPHIFQHSEDSQVIEEYLDDDDEEALNALIE